VWTEICPSFSMLKYVHCVQKVRLQPCGSKCTNTHTHTRLMHQILTIFLSSCTGRFCSKFVTNYRSYHISYILPHNLVKYLCSRNCHAQKLSEARFRCLESCWKKYSQIHQIHNCIAKSKNNVTIVNTAMSCHNQDI